MFFNFLYSMLMSQNLIIMSAKIGIFSGLVTTLVGMAFAVVGFTDLNLGRYFGCLLTGQANGRLNFIAGFLFHIFASALLIFGYQAAFFGLKDLGVLLPLHVKTYLMFAMVHTFISGSLLVITDRMNRCVRAKSIKAMGFMASNYGLTAVVAFISVHLLYGVLCCELFIHIAMKSALEHAAKTVFIDAARLIFNNHILPL